MSADEASLRRTPLYEEHLRLAARMVPFAGWEMPVQYRGLTDEHRAVRSAAGLFDVSHMGELVMSGEYAGAVVDYLVTGHATKLEEGQALYTCACNEQGTILDDLIVYRLARESFLIVCNAGNLGKISEHFRKAADHHCQFEDQSDQTALIALQGPRALEILALTGPDGAACASLGSFRLRSATLGGARVTVARTGYTGEDGVEMFCPAESAAALFRSLLELGGPMGLEPVGLGARDTLRLEAKLALYGNDIDETINPLEAGLARIVDFDKGDFIGRAALAAIRDRGVTRRLIGFEVTGRGIARHGYPLLDAQGNPVGICTSGSPSPTLAKNIGLGFLPKELAAVGSTFQVDCRGKAVAAVVVKTPFYKRTKTT